MAWRSLSLGLAGLVASAILIYFAKPIAVLLLSSFGIEAEIPKPLMAETIGTTGRTFVRASGQGAFSKLGTDTPLFQRDELKTEKKSRIHLRFKSGYEIEVLEESQAILDIWSGRNKKKPDYISFLRGDFRVLQKGTPGQLYIVLDDEVFTPEERPEKIQKSFKISTSVPATAPSNSEPETLPDTVSTRRPNPKSNVPDKVIKKGSETLSSAYIESKFMNRAALFRRCQLTSLRDNKLAAGNMLFSLVIMPNGRVKKVKLLQKSFENAGLESCVTSVIERTKFKAFNGTAISLSYPLNFQ